MYTVAARAVDVAASTRRSQSIFVQAEPLHFLHLVELLRTAAMTDKSNMDDVTETTSQVSQDSTSCDSDPGNVGRHRLRRDKSVSFPDQLTGGGVSTNQSLTMVIGNHDDDDEDDASLDGGAPLSDDASRDGASDSHSIAAPDDPYDSDSYTALAGSGFLVKAAGLDTKDDGADVMDDGESSSNGDKTSEAGETGSQPDKKRRLRRLRGAADRLDFGGTHCQSSSG